MAAEGEALGARGGRERSGGRRRTEAAEANERKAALGRLADFEAFQPLAGIPESTDGDDDREDDGGPPGELGFEVA